MSQLLKLFALVFILTFANAVDNGLGKTPQMGWNSWNHYGCETDQHIVKKTADKIVELGLHKKGYVYVNIDDCWQIDRNQTTGQIIPDKKKYPSGMEALAKYVHDKGLKFGLYSDAGYKTCKGRPGSYGYQKIDAQTYAKWGVDYLKYDNCNSPNVSSKLRYYTMGKALNQTGRPIFFSMCSWGVDSVWEWAAPIGNSWRTTFDIHNHWNAFLKNLELQVGLQKYAGPGGWNDPDMLEVGNDLMTHNQYQAHFALWCLLKAPLLMGCNVIGMTERTLQILGNQQLIAINQDPLGIQGRRIKTQNGSLYNRQVWGGPLSGDRYAIIFFNKGDLQTKIQVSLKDQLKLDYQSYSQRDPIRRKDLGQSTKDVISQLVGYHSVQVRILKLKKKVNLVTN